MILVESEIAILCAQRRRKVSELNFQGTLLGRILTNPFKRFNPLYCKRLAALQHQYEEILFELLSIEDNMICLVAIHIDSLQKQINRMTGGE